METSAKMKSMLPCALALFCIPGVLHGQAKGSALKPLLTQHLTDGQVVADELQHFLLKQVPPLPQPSNAQQWSSAAKDVRERAFSVIYHGWPQGWINSAPSFVKEGVIERQGYRIVKLRFEVVPGFFSTALLYEPSHLLGKAPAILNVNGHGEGGKAVEQKQKRCINQARRGMIALSLEWFGYGELQSKENKHNWISLLDLAGVNGLGLFYLEMRRGLDYLYQDPDVDRSRIGVTGVSGGGWQTILLSGLDTRVGPAVPVAGFSSLTTAIEHPEYAGDAEQNASDFRGVADYAVLAAMRAPRSTLLIYNEMDDCCFRAGVVKQGVYGDIKPFYSLFGNPDNLQWYGNQDPGTHNYGIDNRERSYQFFDNAFHIKASDQEDADTDAEVRSYDELAAGLPEGNLTIVQLAQHFAKSIHHEVPEHPDSKWALSQQSLLREDVRYAPVTVSHAWVLNSTHEQGMASHSYRFEFSNGLSATGVLFQSLDAHTNSPTTILMPDSGMLSALSDVGNEVNRGHRVLVFQPLFFGENVPGKLSSQFAELINTLGKRPLGIEAAQLTAIIHWLGSNLDEGSPSPGSTVLREVNAVRALNVVTTGPRSETVATVAAALVPELFSTIEMRESIPSLADVFADPSKYRGAPEMTCLNLYHDFDFNVLQAIALPVREHFNAAKPQQLFWQ